VSQLPVGVYTPGHRLVAAANLISSPILGLDFIWCDNFNGTVDFSVLLIALAGHTIVPRGASRTVLRIPQDNYRGRPNGLLPLLTAIQTQDAKGSP